MYRPLILYAAKIIASYGHEYIFILRNGWNLEPISLKG